MKKAIKEAFALLLKEGYIVATTIKGKTGYMAYKTPQSISEGRILGSKAVIKSHAYKELVKIWLEETHPGWTFSAMHGMKIKSIQRKIEIVLKSHNLDPSDDRICDSFRKICTNLPEWYKDKDLPIIDSKFNEIVEQIKRKNRITRSDQPSKYRN